MDFCIINNFLYCGTSNGTIFVFKRVALLPVYTFKTHAQRLYNLCPIFFETIIQPVLNSNTENYSGTQSPSKMLSLDSKINSIFTQKPLPLINTSRTKQHCLLLTMGRALAPFHEDLYLSSSIYRLDALKSYNSCLIWCSWDCNSETFI
jgi:hypothetical protein